MELARLVWRNLLRRKLRTLLTLASLMVAFFLLCLLRTLVTTLASGTESASSRRLIVQSAVSLFVDLPLNYQAKIEQVPGVDKVVKWQWFGGYYQEESNIFAQFAVDPEGTFFIYPEMEVIEGSKQAFFENRRGCVIGEGLANQFGWELGDTVPIIPTMFQHPDGEGVAWEFEVEAIYRPTQRYFDDRILLFQWDYFQKTMEATYLGARDPGTYIAFLGADADPVQVMGDIDRLFENGPQRVQATGEAEFQRQFISMVGNIPFFVGTIGGGVMVAILLAVVNTMLMAGREQTHDLGLLKALGFGDRHAAGLLIAQALLLCLAGAGGGMALAWATEPGIASFMKAFFPGFHVEAATYRLGLLLAVAMGLVAGFLPAWRAMRLRPAVALGARE